MESIVFLFTFLLSNISILGADSLKVYDILGNELATLINEDLPAGGYKVEFDSGATHPVTLTSGIYFYRLKAGESFIDVKKMILMK